MLRWCVVIILLLPLLGCGGRQPIAIVGGKVINRAAYIEALERYYGARALRWLVQRQLLLNVNEQRKLVSDKDVEREFKNAMRQIGYQDERHFLADLARQGLDKEAFMEELKFNLILNRLREEVVKPDDKKLKAFYDQNKLLFAELPIVRFYLFQAKDEAPLRKVKDLIKKGEDIGQLAYEFYKDDPQMRSARGLVMLRIPLILDPHIPLPAPPTLLNLLVEAPINQLVGPKQIPEGRFWVLVKVIERTKPIVPLFEDIKPWVRAEFVNRTGPRREVIIQQLASKSPVTVQDPRFKFLEDEIRTQAMLEPPSAFQPPPEVPEVTRPPAKEGERLEERVR